MSRRRPRSPSFRHSSLHAAGVAAFACCAFGSGCNSLDDPEAPPADSVRVIATDERTPKRADSPPPAIQGGSMLALSDAETVVVGDPDRHRLQVVSLRSNAVTFEVALGAREQPGRLVEDASGQVHVVLRGSGKLAQLDPTTGELVRQRKVCGEPRGLAYDAAQDALLLACADGNLATYSVETGEKLSERFVARDLRDVVLTDQGELWVSTFRDAELFRLSANGDQDKVKSLPGVRRFSFDPETGEELGSIMPARAAWRMVEAGDGVAVVHQRVSQDVVEIEPHDGSEGEDGQDGGTTTTASVSGGSSYGGGGDSFFELDDPALTAGCGSIVTGGVSMVKNGFALTTGEVGGAILPVDIAVSGNRTQIAIVSAGTRDPQAPQAEILVPEFDSASSTFPGIDALPGIESSSLHLVETSSMIEGEVFDGCELHQVAAIPEPAVSVAFVPGSAMVLVQTRDPAKLYVVGGGSIQRSIDLQGAPVADTGHDLFHRDSGGGIACASCHMEGSEDGHTWHFSGLGPRRTQSLNVRLRGTQPFHWDGTLDDLGPLMDEVFVGRMGGAPQAKPRLDALADWMLDLEPPAPVRPADDAAALRGKKLFESAAVACASCHSGPKYTNNKSVDVGTSDGLPLQVPSLLGVGLRAPLMHTGCAPSLVERFDPACGGGDAHGTTSQLSAGEVDDLVAYLETL